MNRMVRSAIATLFAVLGAAALAMPVYAQSPVKFNIVSQPLADALRQLGAVSNTNIIFEPAMVKGIVAPPVKGEVTPKEALKQLLAGTRWSFKYVDENTVSLVPASSNTPAYEGRTGASGEDASGSLRVARVEEENQQMKQVAAGQRALSDDEASEDSGSAAKAIPEILVKGSRGRYSLNADIRRTADDPQPYVVFSRQQILESGAANLQDFLKNRLTSNAVGSSNEQVFAAGLGRGGNSSINLRGLGDAQTLILVDGRRVAASVTTGQMEQPEINGIPLSSIERIEVLPATASGIYGGGATGGVINIVLKKDYRGAELTVGYESPLDTDVAVRRVDITSGWALDDGKTSFFLSASSQQSNELLERDRDLLSRGRRLILRNNPGSQTLFGPNPPLGGTPNVKAANGQPLQLKAEYGGQTLSSSFTYLPAGYQGAATDGVAALIQNAGQYNLDLARTSQLGAGGMQMVGGIDTRSFGVTGRREFTPRVAAFAEFRWHDTSIAGANNLTPTLATLASTAGNNPFTADVNISIPSQSALSWSERSTTSKTATVGLIMELSDRWQFETDHSWSRSRTDYWSSIALTGGENSQIASGGVDVFRDLAQSPLDLSAYYRPGRYTLEPPTATSLIDTARLSGELGGITLSGLVEYRQDDIPDSLDQYSSNTAGNLFPGAGQQVASAYVEALFHLVRPAASHGRGRALDLQTALRFDRYSIDAATGTLTVPIDTGIPSGTVDRTTQRRDALSPTVALTWRPTAPLMFRTSYGTGFLPPNIRQLIRSEPRPTLGIFRLKDPKRGNEAITSGSIVTGGSPDLKPEDSTSLSAGVVLRLPASPALRFSADWSQVEKRNNITSSAALFGSFSGIVNNEDLLPAGKILRDTPAPGDPYQVGKILQLDTGLINASVRKVEALDIAADYEKDQVLGGSIGLRLAGTWTLHNYSQATAISPVLDLVSAATAGNPLRFRANTELTWRSRRWTVGMNSNYYGPYKAAALPTGTAVSADQGGDGRVSSQIYHDVFVRFETSGSSGRTSWWLRDLTIQCAVKNILDKLPPFDAGNTIDFYSYFGDPRGASYLISVAKKL